KSSVLICLGFLICGAVASPVYADDDLEKAYRQLNALHDQFLENKHYTSRELYEKNRQSFIDQYTKFMDQFRATYASSTQQLEKNMKNMFVFQVSNFHQILLETQNLIGEGAKAKSEYLFEPTAIFNALPWSQKIVQLFMRVYENRIGRKLDLSVYVTKPSEA